jgi:hypothetical protein
MPEDVFHSVDFPAVDRLLVKPFRKPAPLFILSSMNSILAPLENQANVSSILRQPLNRSMIEGYMRLSKSPQNPRFVFHIPSFPIMYL